ncbi:MAG: hypothetical protein GX560_00135 [Deinococcales bacterium]|nr:hypothetical protein [Deinococcales bacterium]
MRRPLPPLLLLLAAAFLGACSGTQEPSLPTLLLVGVERAGQAQLALLEDLRDTDAPPTAPRLQLVEGSARDLRAPAVSLDLTDRNVSRDTAWVLTRSVSGSGAAAQVTSYLYRFAVSQIDPRAPSAFRQLEEVLLVDGSDPGAGVLGAVGREGGGLICPREVRSSRTGAYLLVLDDPRACVPDTAGFAAVWLVRTSDWTARQLEPGNDVLAVPPHTDQAPTAEAERGYFLVGAGSESQVYAVDFEEERADPLTGPLLPADRDLVVDLAANGSLLVALTEDGLAWLDLAGVEQTGARTRSLDAPRRVVADQFGVLRQLIVWDDLLVGLHDDVEDEVVPGSDRDTYRFTAAAGVIDAERSWGYLVGQGEALIVDLLTSLGEAGSLRDNVARLSVPELELPSAGGRLLSVISWVRSAEPPPAP